MHSLPSELQSLIIGQLHKPDYLECITVCKAWYTIFIPLIYESMIIQDNEFMIPFLESMMTRPRCIDACQYIKKLDAIDLLERYTINEAPSRYKKKTINIDFMNMIANCHNLEELHINAKGEMIQGLTYDAPEHLLKLQKLKFYGVTPKNADTIFQCFYHYKSSLTNLELVYASLVFENYTSDMIVYYLASFKSLKTLVIQSPPPAREGFNLLDIILQSCPNLINLFYQDKEKVLMDVTPRTHSLKEMHIGSKDIFLQDIYHLKNCFSRLSKLIIDIERKMDTEVEFVNVLMSMKHLNTLNLSIAVMQTHTLKDALITFWKHASRITPEGVHGHTAKFLSKKDRIMMMQLNFSYNAQYNERVLDTNIQMEDATYVADVLKEIGSSLHVLQIGDSCEMTISLSHLNSLCPYLIKLKFGVYYTTFNNQPHRLQNNLKELHLCYCPVNDEILRAIECLYPQLEYLEMTGVDIGVFPVERDALNYPDILTTFVFRQRADLTLPNTLKRFMFRHYRSMFEENYMLMFREAEDGKRKVQFVMPLQNHMGGTTLLSRLNGILSKPCISFKTSTVPNFEIDLIEADREVLFEISDLNIHM